MTSGSAAPVSAASGSFAAFVAAARAARELVVQPRMGMDSPRQMRSGLAAVKAAAATTVGTITVDSFTRTGDEDAVRSALARGEELNGYPLTVHSPEVTRKVLAGVRDGSFPVQVRHGSARPQRIFRSLVAAGIDATEGGPVSYCLPYSRVPLDDSVRNWNECCGILAAAQDSGKQVHLETFGGCLLGQLCPPSLLIAVSVLEALYFRARGIKSVSLSYAQQCSARQDREAINALRRLAADLLPDVDWHIVLYAYMGVYPRTPEGASALLESAAQLAVEAGVARLIVKTTAEAHRIPTIPENIAALETAALAARSRQGWATHSGAASDTGLYDQARSLVATVLDLSDDVGSALVIAFERGYLDIPFCLHPDNANRSRSYLDSAGELQWSSVGSMPIRVARPALARSELTSGELLRMLSHVADAFDRGSARELRNLDHGNLDR